MKFNLINKDRGIEPIALISNMPCDEKVNQKMDEVKSINFLGTNFHGVGVRGARTRKEFDLISSSFHEEIGENLSQLEKDKQILLRGEVKPLHDKYNTSPWHLRKLDYGDQYMADHMVEWFGGFDPWGENHSLMF